MIHFYKYHGAGNDFIMINNLNKDITLHPNQIKQLCDRHLGIGADGVILLELSDKADCLMNYYNSDGTIAEMCGNGIRCTAKFFIEQTKLSKARPYSIKVDTRAGIKNIKCNDDDTYSVNMGAPLFTHSDFPEQPVSILGMNFDFVSMGNPHAVTLVDDLDKYNISLLGAQIENNEIFPNKINVEFVEKVSDSYYKVKVWERGCGITLACGTGACAIYAICNRKNLMHINEVTLEFPGGKLFLSNNEQDLNQSKGGLIGRTSNKVLGHVILRGPAEFVFKGEVII